MPAVDLTLELSVHLLKLDAVPQFGVEELLAEPLPSVLQAEEAGVVHSGVIGRSEPVIRLCNSRKVNQNEGGEEVLKEKREEKI